MPRKKKVQRRERFTGSIKRQANGKAVLRWYENGLRQKKTVPGDLAEKLLSDIMLRIQEGQSGLVSLKREFKNVDEYAQHWFSIRLTTANDFDKARYELHLKKIIGHLPATAITPAFIRDEIVIRKKRTHGGATVKNMVRILSSMFSDMAEDGLVDYNPFKSLGKKTRGMLKSDYDPKNGPWLKDPESIPALFAELEEPLNYFFAVGAMTGMRPGEIRGLDWSHIDWQRKRITIQQQANEREHRLAPCKDRDSRIVPILPELYPLLREWWEKCGGPKEGLVFLPMERKLSIVAAEKARWVEEYYRAHLPGKLPSIKDAVEAMKLRFDGTQLNYHDHMAIRLLVQGKSPRTQLEVVPAPKERQPRQHFEKLFIGIQTLRTAWHSACRKLGLPRMRFYDGTRHTFGTQWIVSGGTRDEIKDLLGHSDLSTTERYIHMAKTFEGQVRNLFGADSESIRKAINAKELGRIWKVEGREEPAPEDDEEDAADAI